MPQTLTDQDWQHFHDLRRLLAQWEAYARTLADAGVIAMPGNLLGKTVGLLDATAC